MINALSATAQVQNTSGSVKNTVRTTVSTTDTAKKDDFVSNNPKLNLEKAIKDGSLTYTEATTLLGITLREGFYTYTPKRGETLAQIKQKFGIPDKVISSMNAMYDNDYCPGNDNKTVKFKLDN